MLERFSCLRRKEVVNVCDGCRLGYVGDLEIKYPEGEIKAIVVFGRVGSLACSAGERITTSRGSACRSSAATS